MPLEPVIEIVVVRQNRRGGETQRHEGQGAKAERKLDERKGQYAGREPWPGHKGCSQGDQAAEIERSDDLADTVRDHELPVKSVCAGCDHADRIALPPIRL